MYKFLWNDTGWLPNSLQVIQRPMEPTQWEIKPIISENGEMENENTNSILKA